MKSNRIYLATLLIVLLAFMPAVLLRDFNLLNELNYLGIAQDALDRGAFFTFYHDGAPYADKPPFYLWLCMIGLWLFGASGAMSFVLFISVLSLVFTIGILDRAFASNFRHQERLLIMLGMGSLLFVDVASLLGRMDMIFSAVMLCAYVKLIRRYELLKNAHLQRPNAVVGDGVVPASVVGPDVVAQERVKYGNLAIPLCLFFGIFIKGPYALIMPLVALIMVLLVNKDLKHFFKIFRPYYILIILLCCTVWAAVVYLEGGSAYLENLFIKQSAERLSGNLGHPEPFYYFLVYYPVLSLPIALCTLYFMISQIVEVLANRRARKVAALGLGSGSLATTASVTAESAAAAPAETATSASAAKGTNGSKATKTTKTVTDTKEAPVNAVSVSSEPPALGLKLQACLFFSLAVLLVLSIPSSKLEIYFLPAVPTLYYYTVLSYRHLHERVRWQKERDAKIAREVLVAQVVANSSNKDASNGTVKAVTSSDEASAVAHEAAAADGSDNIIQLDGGLEEVLEHSLSQDRDQNRYQDHNLEHDLGQSQGQGQNSNQAFAATQDKNSEQSDWAAPATTTASSAAAAANAVNAAAKSKMPPASVIGSGAALEHGLQADDKDGSASAISGDAGQGIRLPGVRRWGLEIVGSGYLLSGLNMKSDRVKLPCCLTLSLLLPLLVYVALVVAYFVLYNKYPYLQSPMIGIAFGVLAFVSANAIIFLVSRLFLFALAATGVGTLGFIFCLGLALPFLNGYIGVGSMANEITKVIDQGASTQVCAYRYRNSYSINVYDKRFELLDQEQDLEKCLVEKGSIIFSRHAIREKPEFAQKLRDLGAKQYGDNLLLLAPLLNSLAAPLDLNGDGIPDSEAEVVTAPPLSLELEAPSVAENASAETSPEASPEAAAETSVEAEAAAGVTDSASESAPEEAASTSSAE